MDARFSVRCNLTESFRPILPPLLEPLFNASFLDNLSAFCGPAASPPPRKAYEPRPHALEHDLRCAAAALSIVSLPLPAGRLPDSHRSLCRVGFSSLDVWHRSFRPPQLKYRVHPHGPRAPFLSTPSLFTLAKVASAETLMTCLAGQRDRIPFCRSIVSLISFLSFKGLLSRPSSKAPSFSTVIAFSPLLIASYVSARDCLFLAPFSQGTG